MINPLFQFDCARGRGYVCGADEVGRACLAGPLVAAAVRFDYRRLDGASFDRLAGLKESKKLSPGQRAVLLPKVLDAADMVEVVVISAGQIDREGLHVSNMRALAGALEAVAMAGSVNLVDGYALEDVELPHQPLVRGDAKSAAIAAASIVAKETRDGLMRQMDDDYPGYGFAAHKGYNTTAHRKAVVDLGVSGVHRLSIRSKAYAALARRTAGPLSLPKGQIRVTGWNLPPRCEAEPAAARRHSRTATPAQ